MEQLYIRKRQCSVYPNTAIVLQIVYICANHLVLAAALLQNAELLYSGKKLFLIRSAVSGLTVILPNMDRMAGGELE